MSILCHIAAMAATVPAPAPRAELTTPPPVYTGEPAPHVAPPGLEMHERTRALAAQHHARKRYPGPAGEVLAREIAAYGDFGFRVDQDSPVARLIRELMT